MREKSIYSMLSPLSIAPSRKSHFVSVCCKLRENEIQLSSDAPEC